MPANQNRPTEAHRKAVFMSENDSSIFVKVPAALLRQLAQISTHTGLTMSDVARNMLTQAANGHDFTGYKVRLDAAESLFRIDRDRLRQMAQAGTIPATKEKGRWRLDVGAMKEQLRNYRHHAPAVPETEFRFDQAA